MHIEVRDECGQSMGMPRRTGDFCGGHRLEPSVKDETQKWVAGVLAERTPGGKHEAGKCMLRAVQGVF